MGRDTLDAEGNPVAKAKRPSKKRPPVKSLVLEKIGQRNQSILRKNMAAALDRPRNLSTTDISRVTGAYLMIEAIAMAYGGYVKFAAWIAQSLGNTGIVQRQRMVNWRLRGGVPLKYVYVYAELLNISPYALNYKAVCEQLPYKQHPSWKEVVSKCTFIPEVHRSKIANRAPYVGYVDPTKK